MSQEFYKNILVLAKQNEIYPYEYVSDFEKFKEELPSKEMFYNSLNDRWISDEEYDHVLNVWNWIEMKTMNNYHDLYSKCDVLLFVDVFKKFRNNK